MLCIYYQFNSPIEFIHIDGDQSQERGRLSIDDANEANERASLTADRLELKAERILLGSTDNESESGADPKP